MAAVEFEGDTGLDLRQADQTPGITTLSEDALDDGEGPVGQRQHVLRAVAVPDIGGMNVDGERRALSVMMCRLCP